VLCCIHSDTWFGPTHQDTITKSHISTSALTSNLKNVLPLSWKVYIFHLFIYESYFLYSRVNASTYQAVICKPACDGTRPCVRKCCGRDQVLHNDTCINSTKRWQPYLYNYQGKRVKDDRKGEDAYYQIGPPKHCETYSIDLRDEPSEK
jgi:hypothetical protein